MKENIYFLSKKNTLLVKGVAIIFMVSYHILNLSYVSNKESMNSITLQKLIGEFGHICVPVFLFLSGYGLYITIEKERHKSIVMILFIRLVKLLINYWIIFLFFIPIGLFLFDRYTYNTRELLLNFFTLKITYIQEWWFLRLYIQLLFLTPFIYHIVKDIKLKSIVMISTIIYIFSFIMFLMMKMNFKISQNIFFKDLTIIALDHIPFIMGMLFVKYKIFEKFKQILIQYNFNNKIFSLIILVFLFVWRSLLYILFEHIIGKGSPDWFDFIIVPILIYCLIQSIQLNNLKSLLIKLGDHSFNIWLIHPFVYNYFNKIIILLKNGYLVVLVTVLLSYFLSIFIKIILRKMNLVNVLDTKKLSF